MGSYMIVKIIERADIVGCICRLIRFSLLFDKIVLIITVVIFNRLFVFYFSHLQKVRIHFFSRFVSFQLMLKVFNF